MKELTRIAAHINDYGDPRHVEITLDTAFGSHLDDPDAFGHPNEATVSAAAGYVAGVLARVVLAHLDAVEASRVKHGCDGQWFEQCPSSCEAKGHDLLEASEPWASFMVPRDETNEWVRRLHQALAAAGGP